MIGVVVGKPVEYLKINGDKNYLTPLELAALADNHLLDTDAKTIRAFLRSQRIPISGPEGERIVAEVSFLVEASRNFNG